ncbi:protein rep [Helicobacter sp. L8]|uniref:protein rep n=1 Tax=Helicobacter sp. L8 TaxID=2316078 RepID=UPI000EAB8A61|nr:protein rep [Helicobacter sp. L8]
MAWKINNIYKILSDETHEWHEEFMEKYLGKIKVGAFKQQRSDIHYCNSLILASHHGEMGVVRANCCHHRLCTTCNELQASIRSKLIAQHALPQILENHRLIMLTLTVQNCSAQDLHNTITVMHKAFKYLMDTKGENGLKERFDVPKLLKLD